MTATVTKVSVIESMPGLYYITLKLELKESLTVVFDSNFSMEHRIGTTVDITVGKFQKIMQAAIDKYKREQIIFTAAQFDTAIAVLQEQLIV